jgi:hypothetical protein
MTAEKLTVLLAQKVLGWRAAPDRFLLNGRHWVARWRFQPLRNLEDAFRLLDAANPEEYAMGRKGADAFWVRVRLRKGAVGEARCKSKPRSICLAVARALGVDVDAAV